MSYTAKYETGAITNSMLEAAESCPLKFRVLYLDRAQLESRFEKVLDAMSLGILVHEILEKFPQQMTGTIPAQLVLARIQDWGLTEEQSRLMPEYLAAIDMTQADGRAKGKVYTAPTWTAYWKSHYSALDRQVDLLNQELSRPQWFCDIKPMDFLLRAITCVQHYKDLLSEINAGLQFSAVEQTFHVPYQGEVLAGTVDRLDTDPDTQGLVITDYKTGNKAYTSQILHNMNQLHLYAMAYRRQGKAITGFRVVSVERKEIIQVPFSEAAHKIFVENRLPRLIKSVQILRDLQKDELPVLAGRSFSIGCPCPLAFLKSNDPNRCPAVYMEAL